MTDERNVMEEWMNRKNRHPFIGEGLDRSAMERYWDFMSERYSDTSYSKIADEIVDSLRDMNVISSNDTVLDIGSGIGTFAFRLSEHVNRVTCMDISEGMLDQISRRSREMGINNITTMKSDWSEFVPNEGHDVVFSSLCPPMNDPESLLKMESCARKYCVYVSSTNEGRNFHTMIWNMMGKDYTYSGYDSECPFRFLSSKGRDPKRMMFDAPVIRMPTENVIESEIRRFHPFKIEHDINELAEVIRQYDEDGYITMRRRMGMIVWVPKPASVTM